MIEILQKQFGKDMSIEEKLNRTREFLQEMALKIMYDKDVFANLAFVGGTALRVLFNLRRFSEDLDFSLFNKKGYDISKINHELDRSFKLYGLKIESKVKDENNVHNSMLKFPGLLKTLGLSALEEQKLSIKVEIDTNPPKGWHIENTIINKTFLLNIAHFDLPSLYATKLHACFYRKFIKGRDFYDFIWYLGKKIEPNYTLLNNAIKQTEGFNPDLKKENLKEFILKNIKKIDFDIVKKDVEKFLEDKAELKLFDLKTIEKSF